MAAMAVALTTSSQAVAIHDVLATVDNGIPSGDNEINWVNAVINYHNAAVAGTDPFTVPNGNPNQDPETLDIQNYSNSDAQLPAATPGFKEDNSNNLGGDLGDGYLYAIAKYGGGRDAGISIIYYLGGVAFDFPNSAPNTQLGLSHVTFFTPGSTNVPDGGATAALLGLGILGLAAIRRKA